MKRKSVVVFTPAYIYKRIAQLEIDLNGIESRFIRLSHEQYDLSADNVYSLIDKLIDFGVQNNDTACIKFVMSFYGLIKSYSRAIHEMQLIESIYYHE